MAAWFRIPMRKFLSLGLATVLVAGAAFLTMPGRADAHCDSAKGPIVTAAYEALETGNVDLALPYVKVDAESEVKAAFEHAMAVRKLGGEAQQLADRYFAETVVRLHRVGEGASYTGIKEDPEITPGLEAAEVAVATGDLAEVYAVLDKAVQEGVAEYWHKVLEARERAEREGTVAAHRERAEAELIFEKYVFGVEQAAMGLVHTEEGAVGGHDHGTGGASDVHADLGAVELTVNGTKLSVHGILEGHTLMVPLRAVVEAAGGEVMWDGHSGRITARLGQNEISVQIGEATVIHNGRRAALSMAPAVHDGVTFVAADLLVHALALQQDGSPEEGAVHYTTH